MKNSIEVKVKDIYQQTEQKDRNEKYEWIWTYEN